MPDEYLFLPSYPTLPTFFSTYVGRYFFLICFGVCQVSGIAKNVGAGAKRLIVLFDYVKLNDMN